MRRIDKRTAKVRETGFIVDTSRRKRNHGTITSKNVEAVTVSVCEKPSTPICQRSQ